MRAWTLAAALAIATLGGLPTAALAAPSATATPKTQATAPPTATPKPSATPTSAPPTPTSAPTRTPPPAPTSTPPPKTVPPPAPQPAGDAAAQTAPTTSDERPSPTATGAPTPAQASPSPSAATAPATAIPDSSVVGASTGAASIHGIAFVDNDADGTVGNGEAGLAQVDITLSSATGLVRATRTSGDGSFAFDGVAPGAYRVMVAVPIDYVPTTDTGFDVDVETGNDTNGVVFGLISMQAAGLRPPPGALDPSALDGGTDASDDEQIIALASVTSLPLRFAEGRDLMAQVGRRVLGDGLVWLGIPFRTQIDGGEFQYVNCGPASLTMVLAGFGLEVGPSQVRDYLNNMIDNFDTDLGTSLDALSRIGKEAGLTPMDLYSDGGGYRNWSTDAVRWHVQQGHPVITLVKYRDLPGHTKSLSEFDHYIVISGLSPNGFIYNDAAFATTLGYGLEISDLELDYAWDNSSIPHHALALGLDPDRKALSFPELPRKPRAVAADAAAPARNARRLAETDEAERAPLLRMPIVTPTLPVAATSAVGPLMTSSDRWEDEEVFRAADLSSGAPMGLNLEPSDQPTLEPRPGPGSVVPKLLSVVGSVWLAWLIWSQSGRIARALNRLRLPRLRATPLRAALGALLGAVNAFRG